MANPVDQKHGQENMQGVFHAQADQGGQRENQEEERRGPRRYPCGMPMAGGVAGQQNRQGNRGAEIQQEGDDFMRAEQPEPQSH